METFESNTPEINGFEAIEGAIIIDVSQLDPISGMQEIADKLRENFTAPNNQEYAQYIADALNEHLERTFLTRTASPSSTRAAAVDTFENLQALATVEGHALETMPIPGMFALVLNVYPEGDLFGTVYLEDNLVTYKVEVENGRDVVIHPVLSDEEFNYLSSLGRFPMIGKGSPILNPEHYQTHLNLNEQLRPILEAGDDNE